MNTTDHHQARSQAIVDRMPEPLRNIIDGHAPGKLPALPADVTLPTAAQLKRRLRLSGYRSAGRSGGGGWLDVHALGNVQGYGALRTLLQKLARTLPPNLLEIATGQRIGRPTLSRDSKLDVVAGLLAPTRVKPIWRDGPARPLDNEEDA